MSFFDFCFCMIGLVRSENMLGSGNKGKAGEGFGKGLRDIKGFCSAGWLDELSWGRVGLCRQWVRHAGEPKWSGPKS